MFLVEPMKGEGILVSASNAEQVEIKSIALVWVGNEASEVVAQHSVSQRNISVHCIHDTLGLRRVCLGILLQWTPRQRTLLFFNALSDLPSSPEADSCDPIYNVPVWLLQGRASHPRTDSQEHNLGTPLIEP